MTAAFPVVDEGQLAAPAINIEALESIADWKVDLSERILRTELIFLFHSVDIDLEPLKAEVAAFKQVCACLVWRGKDAPV